MEHTHFFIDPLDVLSFRGNKLFGEPGSLGATVIPPTPSVVSGAIRSALLVHKGIDSNRYSAELTDNDPELGTPARPGTFRLTGFTLGIRVGNLCEQIFPVPADLAIKRLETGETEVQSIRPLRLGSTLKCSASTRLLAVLPEFSRVKPDTGYFLTSTGWSAHLNGERIRPTQLVSGSDLWKSELRVGIGLNTKHRSVQEGKLFTVQAVSFNKLEYRREWGDVGFIASVTGAVVPESLHLRLGGDGRAAIAKKISLKIPRAKYDQIVASGKCRVLLISQGVFRRGWSPFETDADGRFQFGEVRGRLVCAAVPRFEVISGFDIARRKPKVAQRVAPVGSVYWIEDLEASEKQLCNLVDSGLWSSELEEACRRAEGFNRFALGVY